MKPRSNNDECVPKRGYVAPFGSNAHGSWIVYTIALVTVVGLLLIGLMSDNYFGPIFIASLFGGAIVGLWLHHREHSFASPPSTPTCSPKEVWNVEPKYLVPFGPYGGGQWTAHPIGLVIVDGLLTMGVVSRTPLSLLVLASLLGGLIVGFLLWLRHR